MYCHAVKLTAWYIAHHLTAFCFVFHCLHAQTALMPDAVLNLSLKSPWAVQNDTWLLITLTLKGIVFSFPFLF